MTIEQWLNNEELPITIWKNKYRNGDESLDEWFERVSGGNKAVAKLIKDKKFIFGGRILANRGITDRSLTLSNCYVISPPEDNLESIFHTAAKLARTYSYGGGCGIDISNLRPKGAAVHNAAKTTSGAVSFMDFYSYVTGLIGQEGRRGALMLSISCNHPDLIDFINLKSDLNLCTKANISVRMTDEFMEAVENDADYLLRWPVDQNIDKEIENIKDYEYNKIYDVRKLHNGVTSHYFLRKIKAKEVFELLAKRNWESAEPGILYWDTISNYNLLEGSGFKYAGLNPCAEEPLPAGGSCLLGSLNLSKFVSNPFTKDAKIEYQDIIQATITAIDGLNEVLLEGLNLHPLQEQRDSVKDWRQIGLGTMGLANMLIKLGIKYGSEDSLLVIESIYQCIARTAVTHSLTKAMSDGCFPKCDENMAGYIADSSFIRSLDLDYRTLMNIRHYGLYNSQLLTCAPTGSISTLWGESGGVEPNYAFSYNRRTVSLNSEETTYKVDANIVAEYKKATGNNELPDYFIASQELDYQDRIKVQSILQKYIDASISSTINLPEETTIDEVFDLYMTAWRYGLKGVTIWRDNCQRQAILSVDEPKGIVTEDEETVHVVFNTPIKKVSDDCIGKKRTLITGCGTLHLTSFFDRHTGQLLETYFSKGSTGGCALFMVGLSRMVSLAARANVSIEDIVDQLKSSGTCPSYAVRTAVKKDTSKGSCCPVAIGYALMDMYKEMQEDLCYCRGIKDVESSVMTEDEVEDLVAYVKQAVDSNPKCPKCGEPVQMIEGCMSCPSCGYSKC